MTQRYVCDEFTISGEAPIPRAAIRVAKALNDMDAAEAFFAEDCIGSNDSPVLVTFDTDNIPPARPYEITFSYQAPGFAIDTDFDIEGLGTCANHGLDDAVPGANGLPDRDSLAQSIIKASIEFAFGDETVLSSLLMMAVAYAISGEDGYLMLLGNRQHITVTLTVGAKPTVTVSSGVVERRQDENHPAH